MMTSNGFPAYETAILEAYGEIVTPPRTGKPVCPKLPCKVPPRDLNDAVLEKTPAKGRIVKILTRVVFGTMAAALAISRVSRAINTSDRHCNARRAHDIPLQQRLAFS